jgi:hypothetical protein
MFADVRSEGIEEWERQVDLRDLAACNDGTGSLTELFFSEDLYDIAHAKHICRSCDVRRGRGRRGAGDRLCVSQETTENQICGGRG